MKKTIIFSLIVCCGLANETLPSYKSRNQSSLNSRKLRKAKIENEAFRSQKLNEAACYEQQASNSESAARAYYTILPLCIVMPPCAIAVNACATNELEKANTLRQKADQIRNSLNEMKR